MNLPFSIDSNEKVAVVTGAGRNNPRATTANEYYPDGDIDKDVVSFFNLDKAGVEFVFNLNFIGTLIPLAVHFSKTNIRVNAIAPGVFVTTQNEKLLYNEDGTKTPRTDKILSGTPMSRFGKKEELIGALLFLTSTKASGFINGIVLPVDGGFSAYSGV